MKTLMLMMFPVLMALNTNANSVNKPIEEKTPVSSVTNSVNNKENKLSDAEAKQLVTRLKEIRDMDKSKLTVEQKHALRKEVMGIRDRLRKHKEVTVVYISGTAIIIILLLILLL